MHKCVVQNTVYYPCSLTPNLLFSLLLLLKCQHVPHLLNRYAMKITWLHTTQAFKAMLKNSSAKAGAWNSDGGAHTPCLATPLLYTMRMKAFIVVV